MPAHLRLSCNLNNHTHLNARSDMCMWPFADVWLEPSPQSSRSPSPVARRYRRKERVKVVRTRHQHQHQEHRVVHHQRQEVRPQSVSTSHHPHFTRCCLGAARRFTSLSPSARPLKFFSHLHTSLFHTQPSTLHLQTSTPHSSPSTTLHHHNVFHRRCRRLRALAR